jgi:hypothetical protein
MYPQADIDDTKGINNLVLLLVLILGTVPKMIDTKTKIEFMAELSLVMFDTACGYIAFYWLVFRFDVNCFIFIFNIKSRCFA